MLIKILGIFEVEGYILRIVVIMNENDYLKMIG